MAEQQKLLIVKKALDFEKWLLNHTNKFPRSHRFSVAAKLENLILDFLSQRVSLTYCQLRTVKTPDDIPLAS